MTVTVAREGSNREVLAELVQSAPWAVVLDVVAERAKSLKNTVFSAQTNDEILQAREAHNQLKIFVGAIYAKAGAKVPHDVAAIFD